jgi:hypothetical protein
MNKFEDSQNRYLAREAEAVDLNTELVECLLGSLRRTRSILSPTREGTFSSLASRALCLSQ